MIGEVLVDLIDARLRELHVGLRFLRGLGRGLGLAEHHARLLEPRARGGIEIGRDARGIRRGRIALEQELTEGGQLVAPAREIGGRTRDGGLA